MRWNTNLFILLGLIFGVALTSTVNAYSHSHSISLDDVSKVSEVALALFTVGLVWLTRVLAEETKKTRLHHQHPHIVATIEPNKHFGFFDFVIENVGLGLAHDITIRLDPDISYMSNGARERKLSECSLSNVPILKAGQRVSTFLTHYGEFVSKATKFTVVCRDTDNNTHTFSNRVDIEIYEGTVTLGINSLERLAKGVEQLSSDFNRISRNRNRLPIDVYDRNDRDREAEAHEQWLAEQLARTQPM